MNKLFSNLANLKITKVLILVLGLFGTTFSVFGNTQTVDPVEITCGDVIHDNNYTAINDYRKALYISTCHSTSSDFNGKDVEYYLKVPQRQEVTIQLYNLRADLDLFLYRIDSNGNPTSCAAEASHNDRTYSEKITATLDAGTYLVIVDGYNSNQLTNYTLEVDCKNSQPQECCSDDPLNLPWLKDLMKDLCNDNCSGEKIYCATYNNRPAIHITPWTTCTDGIGYVYDCNGILLGRYGGLPGFELSGTLVNVRLLWNANQCEENCTSIPSNCDEVICTPRTPRKTEGGDYSCIIDCSFSGGKTIKYWTINGQRINRTSKNQTLVVNKAGKYIICCYYVCDGRVYKCCREVECLPLPEEDCCSDELLSKNWVKNFMEYLCESDCTGQEIWCATYNGRPAIHITPSNTCTDQNGYVYDCDGNELDKYGYWVGNLSGTLSNDRLLWSTDECQPTGCEVEEDCESYRNGRDISSENSRLWRKWRSTSPDGKVSRDIANSGRQSMEINIGAFGKQDVVFKLGNKTRGKYRVAWNMYINRNRQAYFNIQNSEVNLQSNGEYEAGFGYTQTTYQGKWLDIEVFIDLDANQLKLYIDDRFILSRNYRANLGGINFYAIDYAHFYIDNICLQEVNSIPFTSNEDNVAGARNSTGLDLLKKKEESELKKLTTPLNDKMTVYPNPSKGVMTVELDLETEQQIQLTIFNQTGQLVKNIELGKMQYIQEQLDLSDLPNGLYYLKAGGDNLLLSKRFVIQK